jgi:hypothetical protein
MPQSCSCVAAAPPACSVKMPNLWETVVPRGTPATRPAPKAVPVSSPSAVSDISRLRYEAL